MQMIDNPFPVDLSDHLSQDSGRFCIVKTANGGFDCVCLGQFVTANRNDLDAEIGKLSIGPLVTAYICHSDAIFAESSDRGNRHGGGAVAFNGKVADQDNPAKHLI